MKPYLMTVTSNIKKGVDCRLGQKTLLVGENGAGKSSVVQAIQLAAAEFVGDGEGRDVIKTYAAISRFFPSRAKKLTSSVVLSNEEQELYWELKRSGQSFSKGERKEPIKVVFPFSEIETALTGNADAVRAWLSKNVIEKVTLPSKAASMQMNGKRCRVTFGATP
jgi:AAA15 family ATPase/GTPase